jgi:DNA-binding phage protein
MGLTRDFKDTIQARVQSEPAFSEELLREGVECLLSGELETGKAVLRDYINATIGFEDLADLTQRSSKSLMRMFGPGGNPQARNLFNVISLLQQCEGVQLELHAARHNNPTKRQTRQRLWGGRSRPEAD